MATESLSNEELATVRRQMSERARALIASGTRWLRANEVARLAQIDDEDVAKWVREAKLFSIEQEGVAVFPEYAFGGNWHPLPALESILAVQQGRAAIFVAAWFESRSSFLGGQRPREILASDPGRAIAAARSAIDTERYAG